MESTPELKISLNKTSLEWLNEKYKSLTPSERMAEIFQDFDRILFTSSFGTTAVYLIHLMRSQGIHHPVHFINTSFHFEETLAYKNHLISLFDLEVIEVLPEKKQNDLTKLAQLYLYDQDRCCSINKVQPLNELKGQYEIWISGLMGWQSMTRSDRNIFEEKDGILKFYPIIDVTEEQAISYIEDQNLPQHPLKPLGYESVGCKHCTIKGEKRNGRWAQQVKTECGLH
jgi:phosphoadenosine phosphosulfate reductase